MIILDKTNRTSGHAAKKPFKAASGFDRDKPSLVKAVISSLDNDDSAATAPIKAKTKNK